MVFVTLGSQRFAFDRLLKKLDELAENGVIDEEIFAQIGSSHYQPRHYAYCHFLQKDDFQRIMQQADTVITHGGTGAIMNAVHMGKLVIAVPRLSRFGEHIDDHQLEIVQKFGEQKVILACMDPEELENVWRTRKQHTLVSVPSETERIIQQIEQFLMR